MTESGFSFEHPKEQRTPIGWILLALLFALDISSSWNQYFSGEKKAGHKYAGEEMQYEQVVSGQLMSERLLQLSPAPSPKPGTKPRADTNLLESLDPTISKLSQVRLKDREAAMLFASMRTEQGNKVRPEDLILLRDGDESDKSFYKIYTSETLTPDVAKALSAKVKVEGFIGTMARVHAAEKSGDKTVRAKEVNATKALLMGLITVAACTLFGVSLVVWFFYFQGRANGRIVIQGLPLGEVSAAMADHLAIRAGLLLATFAIGGTAISEAATALKLPEHMGMVIFGVFMIAAGLMLSTMTIGGRKIPWKLIGLSTDNLGRHILWGVAAWIANLPLLAIAAMVGMSLTSGLPTPTHPVSEELMKHQDPKTVLTLLFFGAIVAPIWEEIMFRGLLFPALSQKLKGVMVGGVVSSLLFAMIHPQGLPIWLALAAIAGMNCALVNHTRSLVPSIVLHMLHNFLLLSLTVALGAFS